jgi:hypothetical protein
MTRGSSPTVMLGFSATGLACWLLMFAAATDIWHETGRVDLARLPGMHAVDLQAFAVSFYGLFFILFVQLVVTALGFVRARRA